MSILISIRRWLLFLRFILQGPRSLAGKPLAGFRATPDRRIIVLCGMIVSVIWFKNPLLQRQVVAKKTTTWGESGFPSEFLGGSSVA